MCDEQYEVRQIISYAVVVWLGRLCDLHYKVGHEGGLCDLQYMVGQEGGLCDL